MGTPALAAASTGLPSLLPVPGLAAEAPADVDLLDVSSPVAATVAVQAAPVVPGVTPKPGTVALRLVVDDRAERSWTSPRVTAGLSGGQSVALRDDGTLEGDLADDGVWFADLLAPRAPVVRLSFADGAVASGEVQVYLPSTDGASVMSPSPARFPVVSIPPPSRG